MLLNCLSRMMLTMYKVVFRVPILDKKFCRLLHVLLQFLFITSETELDYYYQKVKIEVAETLKN